MCYVELELSLYVLVSPKCLEDSWGKANQCLIHFRVSTAKPQTQAMPRKHFQLIIFLGNPNLIEGEVSQKHL